MIIGQEGGLVKQVKCLVYMTVIMSRIYFT